MPPSSPPLRPRRPQAVGHALDRLAVQDDDLEVAQGGGEVGVGQHASRRQQLAQAVGGGGQEGFADGRGQAAQLLVGGLIGDGQFAAGAAALEALAAGAVGLEQGVADQGHQGGRRGLWCSRRRDGGVEVVEGGGIALPVPEVQDGLGQGEAVQEHAGPSQRVASSSFQGSAVSQKRARALIP